MTNRDRFNKIANFLVQSISTIIFLMSLAILFVVMFITLPDDVSWQDMIKQPENYSLLIVTIILNVQVKLLGGSLVKNKYVQSNEYIFADHVDGKTTGELLKYQHEFIKFNATRTLNNKKAAQFQFLSNYGYSNLEEVRADINKIKSYKTQYTRAKKQSKTSQETYEVLELYKRCKQAPKIFKRARKVKYISTIIHKSFWNYISQSSSRRGHRVLESYKPSGKFGTILQTILFAIVTSILAIQSFRFGYDPSKLPVFIAMLSTIGTNFLTAIILTLMKLKEIPAYVKNKFRELNEFRQYRGLPEATYLDEAAKELAKQIEAEIQDSKERAKLKKERKAAKMTEDSKIALAKEANRKVELEIRKAEAINRRMELEQNKKEAKAMNVLANAIKKGE